MINNPNKQPNTPRIVAVSGAIAAGKDTLANYLVQRHHVAAIEVGAFSRQLAKETAAQKSASKYDPDARRLASRGSEHLMRRLVSQIVQDNEWSADAYVITGVRTPAEVSVLKEQFDSNVLLAFVRVGDPHVRYERLLQRPSGPSPATLQAFMRLDAQMKSEYALAETQQLADVTLWNNGLLEAFYQQIEANLVPHLFPAA